MDDILFPSQQDDEPLFIRPVNDKTVPSFDRTPLEDSEDFELPALEAKSVSTPVPGQHVKISFVKFVQLVANHSFVDVVDKNADEEVIVSGNLLTDLANSHDRSQERRMPLMFAAGLVIGIILTYLLVK